jgi:hypothetical protein
MPTFKTIPKTEKPIKQLNPLLKKIFREQTHDRHWTVIVEETFDKVIRYHFTYYEKGLMHVTQTIENNGRILSHRTFASVENDTVTPRMAYGDIYADASKLYESCKE